MLDLLNQIVTRADAGERLVVCALVRTRGSTPQKTGAIMVVLSTGQTLGTIGGGCVEAEVRTRALRQLNIGGSQLLEFNLNHDLGWDDGLVCGGAVSVALQVIGCAADAAEHRSAREKLTQADSAELKISALDDRNELQHFSLPLEPSPRLIIAGAGHVGAALAAMGRLMDFDVTVIDDRADFATADRFPGAVCKVGPVEVELAKLPVNRHSHVVIVTRGHRRDALALAAVVKSSAAYIGLIGSKRKIITIFEDLLTQQVSIGQLSRVHAPIGLDIGAATPAEIAVSIASELIAVRRGTAGRPAAAMRLSAELLQRLDHPVPSPGAPGEG